jgi:transcriptional regulator with XRE-family HTH domain
MTGIELHAVRERLGLSQRRLGDVLGYSANHIALCERDEREIALRMEQHVLLLEAAQRLCDIVIRQLA